MLILARKTGDAIAIGDEIIIRVLEIKGGQVKIGVEAPAEVAVHREEIYQRIVEENRRAAEEAPVDLNQLATVFARRRSDRPTGQVLGGENSPSGADSNNANRERKK